MKIIVDFNDLTNLIIADLADKGIQVSEQDIEYTENGVEISLDTVAKSKPVKKVKNIKPKQETKVEVETETVSDDTEEEFFDTQTEEVETQTEVETEEDDDDNSLFE